MAFGHGIRERRSGRGANFVRVGVTNTDVVISSLMVGHETPYQGYLLLRLTQDSLPAHKSRLAHTEAEVSSESQPLLRSLSGSEKKTGSYGTSRKRVHFSEGILTNQPKERESELPYKDYDVCYHADRVVVSLGRCDKAKLCMYLK